MALRHAAPGEKVRLLPLASTLPQRKTTALVKTERFEAVHLLLRSGATVPAHAVEGYLTLQCLEGAVTLITGDQNIALESGDWVYLEPDQRYELSAAEDSSLLLTILFEGSRSKVGL